MAAPKSLLKTFLPHDTHHYSIITELTATAVILQQTKPVC